MFCIWIKNKLKLTVGTQDYLPQTPSRNDHLHDPFRQLDLNSDDLIFSPTCPCDNLPYFSVSNTGMLQFKLVCYKQKLNQLFICLNFIQIQIPF
jgi:hypothetical protein